MNIYIILQMTINIVRNHLLDIKNKKEDKRGKECAIYVKEFIKSIIYQKK